jgi:hypothetical protein
MGWAKMLDWVKVGGRVESFGNDRMHGKKHAID